MEDELPVSSDPPRSSPIDNPMSDAMPARRQRENAVLAGYIRGTLWVLLASLPLYAAIDHRLQQPHVWRLHGAKFVLFAVGVGALFLLYRDREHRWTRGLALTLLAAMAAVSAYSAVLSGSPVAHAMLAAMAAMVTGAAVPWGWRGQGGAVTILGLSCVVVGSNVGRWPFGVDAYPTLVTFLGLAVSLPLGVVTSKARQALSLRETQLLQARDELERLNQFRSDFVASMSHELRTPLNVIIGYHEILLEGELGALSQDQTQALLRADANARELLALINATLELSRLDARGATPLLGPVDVGALLDDLARGLRAAAARDHLGFRWHTQAGLPVLYTDPVKLRMILNNLIHNAIKFTERGSVDVRACRVGEEIEFCVADTGIGIPDEMQAVIFEPFRQASPEIHGRFGGVGLGLHLVDRLTKQLGGRVELESQVGRGTRVTLTLPLAVGGAAEA